MLGEGSLVSEHLIFSDSLHSFVSSVFFFGDKLNFVNISGCLVVFSGVLLYKIVFHLEKAEKLDSIPMRVKDEKDDMEGKLIEAESNGFRDEGDEAQSLSSSRAVELVDRHSGGTPKRGRQTTFKDEAGDGTEEKEYVLPKLV